MKRLFRKQQRRVLSWGLWPLLTAPLVALLAVFVIGMGASAGSGDSTSDMVAPNYGVGVDVARTGDDRDGAARREIAPGEGAVLRRVVAHPKHSICPTSLSRLRKCTEWAIRSVPILLASA